MPPSLSSLSQIAASPSQYDEKNSSPRPANQGNAVFTCVCVRPCNRKQPLLDKFQTSLISLVDEGGGGDREVLAFSCGSLDLASCGDPMQFM